MLHYTFKLQNLYGIHGLFGIHGLLYIKNMQITSAVKLLYDSDGLKTHDS